MLKWLNIKIIIKVFNFIIHGWSILLGSVLTIYKFYVLFFVATYVDCVPFRLEGVWYLC
jgi:hypothetical protein